MRITYIIIPLLLIGGCSGINVSSAPFKEWAPPEYYKTNTLEDGSTSFIRSKKPDFAEPLTLALLLDIALKNNPTTRQAWEDSRAKQAILRQEQSQLFPKVTVGADGTREKSVATAQSGNINDLKYGPSGKAELLLFDFGGRDAEIETAYQGTREKSVDTAQSGNINDLKYGPSGKAELLLFDFGGRDAEIETAYQDMISSGFQFNQSLQDLILDVKKNYYGLYSATSTLEAAESDVFDAKASFEAAAIRFQVGLVSKLDQLQAEASYDDSLYNLEEAKYNLNTARSDLSTTLGYSADTKIEIVNPGNDVPTDIDKQDVTEMIDEALLIKPDIQAARADLKSKEAAVQDAKSSLWPHVNLGGTMGQNWYKYYNEKKPRNDDYAYTGYLSLQWDVFDGFYNMNKKYEAQAEESAQRAKLIELELEASADVWAKFYNYTASVSKLKYSEAFLKSSKASYDLAFEGYGAGLKNILDLLQAQSTLSEARAKFLTSRKDLFVSVAELAHATGTLKVSVIQEPEE